MSDPKVAASLVRVGGSGVASVHHSPAATNEARSAAAAHSVLLVAVMAFLQPFEARSPPSRAAIASATPRSTRAAAGPPPVAPVPYRLRPEPHVAGRRGAPCRRLRARAADCADSEPAARGSAGRHLRDDLRGCRGGPAQSAPWFAYRPDMPRLVPPGAGRC